MGMDRAHLIQLYPPETVRSVCWVVFLLDITRACKNVPKCAPIKPSVRNTCCRGCAALTWLLEAGRGEDGEGGGAGLPDLLDLRVDGQEVSLAVNFLVDLTPDQRCQQ